MHKTLIISDIHLGTSASRASKVTHLITTTDYSKLIILGDLFEDIEAHKRLNPDELKLLSSIRTIAEKGDKEVIWVRGNHDEGLAHAIPELIGAEVHTEYRWEQHGKHFIAVHGDVFDKSLLDNFFTRVIAAPLHRVVKRIDKYNQHLGKFVENCYALFSGVSYTVAQGAVAHARTNQVYHIFCGHTHYAMNKVYNTREADPVHYYNIGCWTRSPSTYAIVDEKGVVHTKKFT